MKFLHLSDLHLGRSLHRFSLEAEQAQLLETILAIVKSEQPDAVLIAGDIYDRSIPPVYATQLLDTFLAELSKMTTVCIISGNHDQAERLAFLAGPLKESGIHVSPAYRGEVEPITLTDADGEADVWLLPFVKAATVRPFFPDDKIETTHEAVACALRHLRLNPEKRNILVSHQFVAGGVASGSEESLGTTDISVGGIDMVGCDLFDAFDYVALGHIHRAQNVGSPRIRYCGTPMAYDFSEAGQDKSVTIAELDGSRKLQVRTIPIPPPRRLVEVRGAFSDITAEEAVCNADKAAFTHVILTDDTVIPDVMNRLRQIYPRLARLDWDNTRTNHAVDLTAAAETVKQTPYTLFAEFFRRMSGMDMSEEQSQYLSGVIDHLWGGSACDR